MADSDPKLNIDVVKKDLQKMLNYAQKAFYEANTLEADGTYDYSKSAIAHDHALSAATAYANCVIALNSLK